MMKYLSWTGLLLTGIVCWHLLMANRPYQDPLKESIRRGEEVYQPNCQNCHMVTGEGMEAVYPPLAKADYLVKNKDPKHLINIILQGQKGEITVNGKPYNTDMPAQDYLTDEQIADVLNYIQNTWGNKGKLITPAQVKTERNKKNNSNQLP